MISWTNHYRAALPRFYTVLVYAMLAGILVTAAADYNRALSERPPVGDGIHNLAYAYNLVKFGVYSAERTDEAESVIASKRREPLYPAILAVWVFAVVDFDEVNIECLMEQRDACADVRRALKYPQWLLMLTLVAAAFWAGSRVSGNRALGLFAAYLIATNPTLYRQVDGHFTEILAALLLLVHCCAFATLIQSRLERGWITGGISLGLLAITKSVFFYWILLLLPVVACLAALNRLPRRRAAAVFAVCVLLPPGAWIARNTISVDDSHISGRGGEVLSIRAEYSSMTWREYWTAYLYYTPLLRDAAIGKYGAGRFEKFDRSNPEGYYRKVKRKEGLVYDHLPQRDEDEVRRRAFGVLLDNWPMQTALMPLFAYRGVFSIEDTVESFLRQTLPAWVFLFGTIFVLRARRGDMVMFTLPVWYSIAFHATLTHFNPRFSHPLLAPMTVFSLWLVLDLSRRALVRMAGTETLDERALATAVANLAASRRVRAALAIALSGGALLFAAYHVVDPIHRVEMGGQVFWKHTRGERFSELKSHRFKVNVDGASHTYSVRFPSPVQVAVLRLDPVDEPGVNEVKIDYIRSIGNEQVDDVEFDRWRCFNCNWQSRKQSGWILRPHNLDPYIVGPYQQPAEYDGLEVQMTATARMSFGDWLVSLVKPDLMRSR